MALSTRQEGAWLEVIWGMQGAFFPKGPCQSHVKFYTSLPLSGRLEHHQG